MDDSAGTILHDGLKFEAFDAGARAALAVIRETVPGRCGNCGGSETQVLTVTLSGPYQSPSAVKRAEWRDGSWYEVERKTFPCPVCSQRPDDLASLLLNRSRLQVNEFSWRVDWAIADPAKVDAIRAAQELISTMPRATGLLTYFGSYGVGKTGLLKSLVAAACRYGLTARYYRMSDLLQTIRDGFDNSNRDESRVLSELSRVQLLAIDEVDRINRTEWSVTTACNIIDDRYEQRWFKATVMASNSDEPDSMPPEFAHIADRIKDGIIRSIGGSSLRG